MSQNTLKWLRLATPGVIIVCFWAILGRLTGLWLLPLPNSLKDTLVSANVLIPAGIYYLLPFRTWANRRYFDAISANLRAKLIRVSGFTDDPDIYTWTALRGAFFHFIDNDQSLSKKAALAYFNGYIWTTCADVRVIACTYACLAAILYWIGVEGSVLAVALFVGIVLASYLGSAAGPFNALYILLRR
jgi:hypothetical protein